MLSSLRNPPPTTPTSLLLKLISQRHNFHLKLLQWGNAQFHRPRVYNANVLPPGETDSPKWFHHHRWASSASTFTFAFASSRPQRHHVATVMRLLCGNLTHKTQWSVYSATGKERGGEEAGRHKFTTFFFTTNHSSSLHSPLTCPMRLSSLTLTLFLSVCALIFLHFVFCCPLFSCHFPRCLFFGKVVEAENFTIHQINGAMCHQSTPRRRCCLYTVPSALLPTLSWGCLTMSSASKF